MVAMTVRIRGDGVAARCCAHLLHRAGVGVLFEPGPRARVPAILLSEAAQKLIRDVFERDDLFRQLPRITRRVVQWGAAPVELPHSAVVISEEDLLNALPVEAGASGDSDWTVCAALPLPVSTVEHRFGSRMASAVKVQMRSAEDTCWIESLEGGWLFLNSGWLLAVGGGADALLENSTLVKGQIDRVEELKGRFPASPRMISPLGENGWIACGSAAMGFDPLCGDGTAHAVREAILASAVIAGSEQGDVEGLLAHYEARLTAGLERHLSVCRQFYSAGGSGEWWKAELRAVQEGMDWCAGKMDGFEFRYKLEGVELKALR